MVMPAHRPHRGFTLIEMLVVISILGILMSLGIFGINHLRRLAMKTRTQAILAMVLKGLNSAGATQAQNLGTVEHPLAASAAPRYRFIRASGGTDVAAAGMAIKTLDMAYVPTVDRDRVLLADDRFADPMAPQFIGLPRWQLATIGVSTPWVSQWVRISGPGQTGIPVVPDLGTWVDEGFLRQAVTDPTSVAWEQSADKAFSVTLGAVLDELTKLGAVRRPDTTRDTLMLSNRLRQDLAPKVPAPSAQWRPGTINVAGSWTAYRLRGPNLVDVWGREILIGTSPTGSFRLQSAGLDGMFRWAPGRDGILQTTADATAPAGDDQMGDTDNITLGNDQ